MLFALLAGAYAETNWLESKCDISFSGAVDLAEEPQLLSVSGDLVNLRSGPSIDSEVLRQVRLGAQLEASSCINEEEIGGRKGCWMKVALVDWEEEELSAMGRRKKRVQKQVTPKSIEGFVFSTALSSCTLFYDWDQDGVEEEIFGSVIKPGVVQIRARDPDDAPHIFWKSTQEYGDIEGPILSAQLKLVDVEQTGTPLLGVVQQGAEACGGYTKISYLSYNSDVGIQDAIQTISGSDSPAYQDEQLEWSKDNSLNFIRSTGDGSEERVSRQKHCAEKGIYTPCGALEEEVISSEEELEDMGEQTP